MGVMASPSTTNFSNFASCLSITGQPCCHDYSNMQLAAVAQPQVAVPVGMFLGEGFGGTSSKMVQRVVNLEFVEMYELQPESWLAAEGSDTH